MMKNKTIDKEKLKNSINNITNEQVSIKEDIKLSDLLELKEAISPINNYITSKLTEVFIKKLRDILPNISEECIEKLSNENNNVNVNANGFDFINHDLNIVAEVKANRPYGMTKYGAAQITGIKKDINGLLNGKKTDRNDIKDYYKFMVLLKYEKNNYSSIEAISNLIKGKELKEKVIILDKQTRVNRKDVVYIILLEI